MKKILGISTALILLAAIVISATVFQPTETKENNSVEKTAGLSVGDIAPDFKLKDVSGETVSLANYKDAKGFIITFTCNTCPYSVMYEDRLIELHKAYADKGYPVVAINPNDPEVRAGDSYDAMKVRAKEKAFPFRYLFDEGQKIYPAYGASRTPHVYILDKTRKVRYIGAIDDNAQEAEAVTERYVEKAIAQLQKGENPNPDFTKAIGCTIKVKK